MRRNDEELHTQRLDNLVRDLHLINENRHDIVSIIREPIWTPDYGLNCASLCDLILIYYDHTTVPIEFKGHFCQERHGNHQVRQGFDYSQQVLRMDARYGKFTWYENRTYRFKKIEV